MSYIKYISKIICIVSHNPEKNINVLIIYTNAIGIYYVIIIKKYLYT